ncbi:nuclear pore complex protein Nup58-like isoform X2 [Venturia canescens]|uniref:nuclear pore complex protein Nup58-like isoform X2 n=1 Tax=Venturia canescens TaxID=32260 RepID=UPI001C9C725C|nr:nuclear pore complex protein Nup58-like isoform X2 [Venturia canescens]
MSKFSFGTPATTAANTNFAFGTPKSTTTTSLGGTTFGAQTIAASGSLTFGTPATSTTATPALNFSFGATTTSTPGQSSSLSLGSTTATTTPSLFGTPGAISAPPAAGLCFGTLSTQAGGGTFGATAGTPATSGFSFGATATKTTTTTTTTTTPSLFGSGLFGVKPISTTVPVIVADTNKGLGGLDVSISSKGLSHGSNSPTVAKENLIPNELTQTIDSFKKFVKMQKSLSSDIARGSSRPLNRCAEDTASLMEMLTSLAGSVQRDRSLADKLKQDTAKALQNAEIAQRTHDTPAGLQYENNAPLQFFMELAESFEQEIIVFRSQIETTEKHIQTMMAPRALTPQELTAAMSKIHESLIAVAGRLQGAHAKVQQQKEQYLNFRKYVLKDSSNVFEEITKYNEKNSRMSVGRITSGPTPFGPGNKSFLSSSAMNTGGRPPSYGTPNPLGLAWI